jgi:hypothetical protein
MLLLIVFWLDPFFSGMAFPFGATNKLSDFGVDGRNH